VLQISINNLWWFLYFAAICIFLIVLSTHYLILWSLKNWYCLPNYCLFERKSCLELFWLTGCNASRGIFFQNGPRFCWHCCANWVMSYVLYVCNYGVMRLACNRRRIRNGVEALHAIHKLIFEDSRTKMWWMRWPWCFSLFLLGMYSLRCTNTLFDNMPPIIWWFHIFTHERYWLLCFRNLQSHSNEEMAQGQFTSNFDGSFKW